MSISIKKIVVDFIQVMLILVGVSLWVKENQPSWIDIFGGVMFIFGMNWRYRLSNKTK